MLSLLFCTEAFLKGVALPVGKTQCIDRLYKIRISDHTGHINFYYILIAVLAISQYTISNDTLNIQAKRFVKSVVKTILSLCSEPLPVHLP